MIRFFYLFALVLLLGWNCKTPANKTQAVQVNLTEVNVVTHLTACADSIRLLRFDGISFKSIKAVKPVNDTAVFTMPASSSPQIYYVGLDARQKKAILVGTESVVALSGSCRDFRSLKVSNSDMTQRYDALMAESKRRKALMNREVQAFRRDFRDPAKRAQIQANVTKLDREKLAWIDSTRKENAFLGDIAALDGYMNYQTDTTGYKNEVEHYAATFFKQVQLANPNYAHIPALFESFKNYSQTLASVGFNQAQFSHYADSLLVQIPAESWAYRYALGGIVIGLQAKNHPAFAEYGKRFIKKYESDKDPAIAELKKKITQANQFAIGSEAPDFTLNTPEGVPLSLSDLRGKVVLVDFWASWCGPCRKENPNVLRLYDKYKDKGFEIIGVSLDKTKDRWVKAIEKDGLPWHHVSDLKGWSNRVAQQYAVRSIPQTVLLDPQGRIIAHNLRGEVLAHRLKQIFGE